MPPWSNKNCSVLTKQGFILRKATRGFLRVWLAESGSKIPSAEAAAKLSVCSLQASPRAEDGVSWQRGGSSSFSPVVSALPEEILKTTQAPE